MNPDGGDYAASKHLKWHRRLSITVVAVLFASYAVRFGMGLSIRHFAAFVVPLILIWFSDELAAWGSQQSGTWFSPHPRRHLCANLRLAHPASARCLADHCAVSQLDPVAAK